MKYTEKGITIKQLAEDDRPREKFLYQGRQHLSNAELIAILIRSGRSGETAVDLAQRILLSCGNNLQELGQREVKDLCIHKGMGEAKSLSLLAALELGRRRQLAEAESREQITNSRDIAAIMSPVIADLALEEFWVLYLNRANRILGKEKLSMGGVSGTVVDIKVILRNAIQRLSSAIVVAHNHPSGTLRRIFSLQRSCRKVLNLWISGCSIT